MRRSRHLIEPRFDEFKDEDEKMRMLEQTAANESLPVDHFNNTVNGTDQTFFIEIESRFLTFLHLTTSTSGLICRNIAETVSYDHSAMHKTHCSRRI
jgi:hypothetical protein